jgi:tetratricopeptide (TPR) repeat protein
MLVLGLLTLGCVEPQPEPAPSKTPPSVPAETSDVGTYGGAVRRLTEDIRAAESRAMTYANDWGRWAEVAALWSQRARLTGDDADWGHAEDHYAVAFAIAPEGSGPLLGRASLNYALHRLDRVDADLAVVERVGNPDHGARAEILQMRGDVALQRGQLDAAAAAYADAYALHPTLGARFGQAQIQLQRGDYDGALAGIEACDGLVKGNQPSLRMWLELQRGLVELARQRYDAALDHYRAADSHVSGHWLVREHIAEATALLGHTDEALAMYREIVLDTNHPEFVDAVAGLLAEQGDTANAARWEVWADAGFKRLLAQYPEAAAGHALDHFLHHGDPAAAVALAEKNAALRPNGEALTLLAEAYRRAGREQDARGAERRAEATGWKAPPGPTTTPRGGRAPLTLAVPP